VFTPKRNLPQQINFILLHDPRDIVAILSRTFFPCTTNQTRVTRYYVILSLGN